MSKHPLLLIHGGAGQRPLTGPHLRQVQASLQVILQTTYSRLMRGGAALDAVTEAVRLLEDDPLYNAGLGSKIQSDGHIRMSASIMDGARRRFGGCVNVEGVRNPVLLARKLMTRSDRVLAGEGARRFAKELGLEFRSPFTKARRADHRRRLSGKSGTVGAVAVDKKGRLAAATSTGGRGFEFPFRVSDSPTVAGNFATGKAAVSATGTGEQIVENGVAATVCALCEAGWTLDRAVQHVLNLGRKFGGDFGLIAVDSHGRFTGITNTKSLIWGSASPQGFSTMGEIK